MTSTSYPSLILITDGGADLFARVARALESEVAVAILLRDKEREPAQLRELAFALRALTRARGAQFVVHSHAELAAEVGADGVHLPAFGASPARAREILPPAAWVGVSCHERSELERAAEDGASYGFLSPIRAVPGKAPPLGIEGFGAIARTVALPVLALGGIEPRDVPRLRRVGAAGIAVMRSVLGSPDPKGALSELAGLWGAVGADT